MIRRNQTYDIANLPMTGNGRKHEKTIISGNSDQDPVHISESLLGQEYSTTKPRLNFHAYTNLA